MGALAERADPRAQGRTSVHMTVFVTYTQQDGMDYWLWILQRPSFLFPFLKGAFMDLKLASNLLCSWRMALNM